MVVSCRYAPNRWQHSIAAAKATFREAAVTSHVDFAWDQHNRLTSVTDCYGGPTAPVSATYTYRYDAFDRRVRASRVINFPIPGRKPSTGDYRPLLAIHPINGKLYRANSGLLTKRATDGYYLNAEERVLNPTYSSPYELIV